MAQDIETKVNQGRHTSEASSPRHSTGSARLEKSVPQVHSSETPTKDEAGIGEDIEKGTDKEEIKHSDPNIVDFEGENDPIKAVNWPSKKKWTIVTVLSTMTLITPLASSMFAPGVPEVLNDFNSTSTTLAGFVISVYILGYATGPIFVGPMSELYGRQIVYHISNILFIIFTIACAVSSNLNMLIGFRLLEGIAGSTVITIGGGTCADLFKPEDRGRAMSLWAMGPLLGPVVGPIAGGFLAESAGWRWVFWVITIAAGVVSILMALFLRETYSSTILERKTKRLRKETGNPNLRSKLDSGLTPRRALQRASVRALKMLLFSPIVFLLSLVMALVYGVLYLLFTTFPEVFEGRYHFAPGIVGLTYIGIGVGMFVGLFTFGITSDRSLKKKKSRGIQLKPEDRLPLLVPGTAMIPIGLFIYGWSAQYNVFWFVPIFGTSFIGIGLIASFMPIQTYVVDAFTIHASSAIAALTIIRSVVGAILPLAGLPMYNALGLGWGNSLLAFVAIALLPMLYLLVKYGERIRTNPRFQLNL